MDLSKFFSGNNVALVGVSRNPNKIGHVILRNLMDGGFKGKIFVVNPNADEILNHKCYKSLSEIKEKIDVAIVAVPAEIILKVIDDVGRAGVKDVVLITSGFREIGNYALDKKLEQLLARYKIRAIGPNCLGTFDAYTKLDSLFLPRYRLQRPQPGGISFICQSGAVGSAIMDYATENGYGFSKFISYGNAMNVDETDLMEFVAHDPSTKVICMYVEGVKNGKKFMKVARKITQKKPVIILKGGTTAAGSKATMSHTGSLAGAAEVYTGVFRQFGIIQAESLEEMFEFAKILEKSKIPKGARVQIITNGGGYGILSTDAIVKNGLPLAELSRQSKLNLKKFLPSIATVDNPIDLTGGATADMYSRTIEVCMKDKNVDIMLVILLYQTPLLATDVVDLIAEANDTGSKPIIIVSTGGEFTEILKKNLEENSVPTYTFPENAVRCIRALVERYGKK